MNVYLVFPCIIIMLLSQRTSLSHYHVICIQLRSEVHLQLHYIFEKSALPLQVLSIYPVQSEESGYCILILSGLF